MKIPSRNKKSTHSSYTICPECGYRIYYDSLCSTNDEIKYFSKNTIIITCNQCGCEFVPDVTRNVDYKYSGHCKRKDGDNTCK